MIDINGYYMAPTDLYSNTALGLQTLFNNSDGYDNTAIGNGALFSNTGGANNTATGYAALLLNTTGSENTANGFQALFNNTTGFGNTALGYNAGGNITGSFNVDIANLGTAGDNRVIRIGDVNTQTSFFAAGIAGAMTGGASSAVVVDGAGQLGTVSSSRRFKEDIQDMNDASSGLLRLRPVTFRYQQPYADGSKPIDYGLIAEEVAEVYPDLVVKGADGYVETVQYHKLAPMLLNELQKEHETTQSQQAQLSAQHETIQSLQAQVSALQKALETLARSRDK